MKRWVLYVDGEEPVYFDGDDVARWRDAGCPLPAKRAEIEALAIGEECSVTAGKVQRLDDEREEVCDVVGCYAPFTTFKAETRCPEHRRTA